MSSALHSQYHDEVSLSKALNPQLLPRCCNIGCPLLCVHCCVCVHLDGLNAEHTFQFVPKTWLQLVGTHARTHARTHRFSIIMVTFHRSNGFYTVSPYSNPTPKSTLTYLFIFSHWTPTRILFQILPSLWGHFVPMK